MSAKHTPGPWRVHNLRVEPPPDPQRANGGWTVAQVYGPDAEANARLIAAAPELLEALAWFVDPNNDSPTLDEFDAAVDVARLAIAKATGREP